MKTEQWRAPCIDDKWNQPSWPNHDTTNIQMALISFQTWACNTTYVHT